MSLASGCTCRSSYADTAPSALRAPPPNSAKNRVLPAQATCRIWGRPGGGRGYGWVVPLYCRVFALDLLINEQCSGRCLMKTRKIFLTTLVLFATFSAVALVRATVNAETTSTLYLPIISAAPPVYISEVQISSTFGGNLRVNGEVRVSGSTPVFSVTVNVKAYNNLDELIGVGSGLTEFVATLPGEPNPFEIYTLASVSQVAYFTTEITSWQSSSNKTYASATVIDIEVYVDPMDVVAVTTIRNDNSEPILNVVGLAWTLTQVSAYLITPVTDYLAPGETFVFTRTISGEGGMPGYMPDVRVAAQGEVVP